MTILLRDSHLRIAGRSVIRDDELYAFVERLCGDRKPIREVPPRGVERGNALIRTKVFH